MYRFKLFVYGTLKQGFPNFKYFCSGAQSIEPAQVKGRMYDLDIGYPMMEVPGGGVADDSDWDWVQGELMSFQDPHQFRIQGLDRLEGYRPGDSSSLYLRVETPVWINGKATTTWCYVAGPGHLLSGGRRITVWAQPSGDESSTFKQ
jgi:gamma-glutamylcyclotransferase (GGCT)/AIG2-like uncharacterized protein YtfP